MPMNFDYMSMEILSWNGESRPVGELMLPMTSYGAPDDCQLIPFDCVMLEQSIRSWGNVPPAWIVAASRAWLRAHKLTPMHLRPAVSE